MLREIRPLVSLGTSLQVNCLIQGDDRSRAALVAVPREHRQVAGATGAIEFKATLPD
jgi:hypothetical protein